MDTPRTGLEMRSLIEGGRLRVSPERRTHETPGPGELLVRVEATPVNPSDLSMMLGPVGWVMFPFLEKAGAEVAARLRARVVAEYAATFASHYSAVVSLSDMMKPEIAAACAAKATGGKYLVDPSRG